MNKKIINTQKNIKKNPKGFLYLFMVFVGPQVNSMKLSDILSYENKLKNINESQITKDELEKIKSFTPSTTISADDASKIKNIQEKAKEILDGLNKSWRWKQFQLVESETPDPNDANKNIKKTVVRESSNWKLISTSVIVPSFIAGLLYTFMKKKPLNSEEKSDE